MGILKKLALIIAPLTLTGCYADFDPEIDTAPVICLNSLITAGQPVDVSVTHTWVYTDTASQNNHRANDATVCIYADGQRVDAGYLPKEGDRLRITADSPAYGHAEAEVSVPHATHVEITGLDIKSELTGTYIDQGYDGPDRRYRSYDIDLKAKVKVYDIPSSDNYYQFAITVLNPSGAEILAMYKAEFAENAEPIFSEHINLTEDIFSDGSEGGTFFTDRQFADKDYTLNIRINDIELHISDRLAQEELDRYGLCMTVYSISRSLYNWNVFDWYKSNSFTLDMADIGLADPMSGYSNVSTGAGVVGAQSPSSALISISEITKQIKK